MRGLDERFSPQYSSAGRSQNQTRHQQVFNDFRDDDEWKHP